MMALMLGGWVLIMIGYNGYQIWLASWQQLNHLILFTLTFVCGGLTVAAGHEKTKAWLDLRAGSLHAVWGALWGVNFIIFHFHKDYNRAYGTYGAHTHMLYTIFVAASSALAFLQIGHPHSFLLDLAYGKALLLQGTWLIQIAFLEYVPGM